LDNSHESPERGSRSGAKPTRTTKDEPYEEQYRIEETSNPQDLQGQARIGSESSHGRRRSSKPAKKSKEESEPVDRLPSNLDELKASKSGLVAYLFLSGKDKEAIATELKAAFKLPEAQAVKITRRITGRARFFQRVGELMAAK
jgi:hypothetical protein